MNFPRSRIVLEIGAIAAAKCGELDIFEPIPWNTPHEELPPKVFPIRRNLSLASGRSKENYGPVSGQRSERIELVRFDAPNIESTTKESIGNLLG